MYSTLSFPDVVHAIWDIWFLGDGFLADIFSEFQSMKHRSEKDKKFVPPYMLDFFNAIEFYPRSRTEKDVQPASTAMARIINSLIRAVNSKNARLPKYLVVFLDMDILMDIHFDEVNFFTAKQMVPELTRYVVRQIKTVLCRKRMDLLEKKPGAASGTATEVIYVCMLHRIGSFTDGSVLSQVCALRPRFNDALNDAVAKENQCILTINMCNTFEHFDRNGSLSSKGKNDFW